MIGDLSTIVKEKPKNYFNHNLEVKSTGTSIIALACKEGRVILGDTQATDTSAFITYNTDKINTYDHNIVSAGAGASIGLLTCITPLLSYFKRFLAYYNYNIEEIPDPYCFLGLWNTACLNYLKYSNDGLYHQIMSMSLFLVNFRNKNMNFTFSTSLVGDSTIEKDSSWAYNIEEAKKNYYVGDMIAIGSGARHLMGGFRDKNRTKLLKEVPLENIKKMGLEIFRDVTQRDAASSIKSHLQCVFIPNDTSKKVEVTRILPSE